MLQGLGVEGPDGPGLLLEKPQKGLIGDDAVLDDFGEPGQILLGR